MSSDREDDFANAAHSIWCENCSQTTRAALNFVFTLVLAPPFFLFLSSWFDRRSRDVLVELRKQANEWGRGAGPVRVRRMPRHGEQETSDRIYC